MMLLKLSDESDSDVKIITGAGKMKLDEKEDGAIDDLDVRDCFYELFAEADAEKYKSPSQVIHSILKKLNELMLQSSSEKPARSR